MRQVPTRHDPDGDVGDADVERVRQRGVAEHLDAVARVVQLRNADRSGIGLQIVHGLRQEEGEGLDQSSVEYQQGVSPAARVGIPVYSGSQAPS